MDHCASAVVLVDDMNVIDIASMFMFRCCDTGTNYIVVLLCDLTL
jgi:hypothetical protein